jgi:CubicO group peptidase (beta-lactamase class C family)
LAPLIPKDAAKHLLGQYFGYFGLGVAVKEDNTESGLLGTAGAYGWSGAYNTYFRIDPKEQLVLILFVQIAPGNNMPLQYGFHNGVMQAISD